jgi:hypothetical protein
MNQRQHHTPSSRTWLIRGSALAAGGVVLAGVLGTGALAAGIESSVHQPGSSDDGTRGPSTGNTQFGDDGWSGNGSITPGQSNGSVPGLSVPAPNSGSVSGGTHGS